MKTWATIMGALDAKPSPALATTELRAQMVAEHGRLLSAADDVLERIREGNWASANGAWGDFEQSLIAHMEAEEEHLIPRFERHDSFEAAAVRDEHTRMRELLAELGIQLELHAVKEDQVHRLADLLRGHAAREQRVMYGWAENELPPETLRSILAKISHRISSTLSLF